LLFVGFAFDLSCFDHCFVFVHVVYTRPAFSVFDLTSYLAI